MKIVVCIKQVPDTTEVKLDPKTNTLIRDGVPSIINPDDKAGIEAALTLKEQKFLDCLLKEQGESRLKELEQLVKEAVKNEEAPGSDREYYQQMKKVKKLLNEKRVTLQELKGYYKVLGVLKQEI